MISERRTGEMLASLEPGSLRFLTRTNVQPRAAFHACTFNASHEVNSPMVNNQIRFEKPSGRGHDFIMNISADVQSQLYLLSQV